MVHIVAHRLLRVEPRLGDHMLDVEALQVATVSLGGLLFLLRSLAAIEIVQRPIGSTVHLTIKVVSRQFACRFVGLFKMAVKRIEERPAGNECGSVRARSDVLLPTSRIGLLIIVVLADSGAVIRILNLVAYEQDGSLRR